ncbi:MAG: peptide ABC transporter substrate-binding protein [Alphaproteobacteria bacterium]|nr:peptide ABC transporter substrate-binding protein [Alphaproteobacteria bacterium]
MKRVFGLLFFLGFVSSFFLQPSPLNAEQNQPTLRRATPTIPKILDPQKQSHTTERRLLTETFTGLVSLDPAGKIIPGVAESWTVSADGRQYTFRLREDAKWHDGAPVVAADFVLAFRRLFALGKKAPMANMYADIVGSDAAIQDLQALADPALAVLAVGSHTLEISLRRQFQHFLHTLTRPPAFPVPSHLYKTLGEEWSKYENIVGNGPYRFDRVIPNESIRLTKASTFYAAETVSIETVEHVNIGQGITIGRFMAAGKADISAPIGPYQIDAVRNLPGYHVELQHNPSLTLLQINSMVEKLADARVRKALYLAADRQAAIQMIKADYTPQYGLVAPLEEYESLVGALPDQDANLETARALMEAAGYDKGKMLEVTLLVSDTISSQTLAAQIKRDWAKIYVDMKLEQVRFTEVNKRTTTGEFEIVRRNWVADYPDPYNFLQLYTPQFNATLFPSLEPALAQLLERADAARGGRNALLAKAEKMMLDTYPAVPLFLRADPYLVSDKVEGWSTAPFATNNSRWLKWRDH